jgi:hypothetical protein
VLESLQNLIYRSQRNNRGFEISILTYLYTFTESNWQENEKENTGMMATGTFFKVKTSIKEKIYKKPGAQHQ